MSFMKRVDYDPIAPTYNRRYEVSTLPGVTETLSSLAQSIGAGRILEVGCGTGHWLSILSRVVPEVVGLDISMGMLREAAGRREALQLTCGRADALPFCAESFDLVCCVNALHHFNSPVRFIAECQRLLRPGGALAVCGLNPHDPEIRWYLYDYFEGTYDADLARYPSPEDVANWFASAGLDRVDSWVAERIAHVYRGSELLDSPFVQRTGTSQLSLLSEEVYATGLAHMREEIAAAEAVGRVALFKVDITLAIIVGYSRLSAETIN